jgi:hypothetical protein
VSRGLSVVVAVLVVAASACAAGGSPSPSSPPTPAARPPQPEPGPPVDAPRTPVPVAPDPLDVSPAAEAFARAPKLPGKLAKSPYAYFRFVNAAFSEVVCRELADFGGTAPVVRLHGDAHLEQYALTDIGRGLTDFDDAATGPAVVDLARMATSLVIASRMRGFQESMVLTAFVEGYRLGLRGGTAARPAVTATLSAAFKDAPREFLDGAEKLMLAEDADPTLDGAAMRITVAELEKEMRARQPDLPAPFFGVKKIGTFKAGIGSALERKFLVRLEGTTTAAEDDRIIEVKYIGDRTRASCMQNRYDFDPRDLREDPRPGALERFVDPIFIHARTAWAQEWYPNFKEVQVGDLPSEAALAEVARDAGALLAREHVRGASPDNLAIDAAREARLAMAARSLADRVEVSWKRFRSRLPPAPEARKE